MTSGHNHEARLDAVFEAAVDGIILIDAAGRIQRLNPAAERMFGYASAEVVGRNVKMLMPSPYQEEHDGYLQRYQATGEKRIIGIGRDVVAQRRDGSTFPMHLSVAEVVQDGERTFAGILRDITAEKAAERAREELISQLEMKNAELERFTYTVSHDLKSPLITIKGFAGQLDKSVASGNMERFRKDVARIGAAADKMKGLLDDLLELSRIGRVSNPTEQVSLRAVVDEAIELLAASIRATHAKIAVDSDLPVVRGDRTRLREVVQNLLENALKFSPDGPEIEISATTDGPLAVCCVRDHGIGLDSRFLDRIFGLFEQLDADGRGSGVGLALVRRIVEVHGGTVWAESEGLGHGSALFFTVPQADAETTPPPTSSVPRETP
jgi:PAS domain S-box-containing protein